MGTGFSVHACVHGTTQMSPHFMQGREGYFFALLFVELYAPLQLHPLQSLF
jgi:hypothetical protein